MPRPLTGDFASQAHGKRSFTLPDKVVDAIRGLEKRFERLGEKEEGLFLPWQGFSNQEKRIVEGKNEKRVRLKFREGIVFCVDARILENCYRNTSHDAIVIDVARSNFY